MSMLKGLTEAIIQANCWTEQFHPSASADGLSVKTIIPSVVNSYTRHITERFHVRSVVVQLVWSVDTDCCRLHESCRDVVVACVLVS